MFYCHIVSHLAHRRHFSLCFSWDTSCDLQPNFDLVLGTVTSSCSSTLQASAYRIEIHVTTASELPKITSSPHWNQQVVYAGHAGHLKATWADLSNHLLQLLLLERPETNNVTRP